MSTPRVPDPKNPDPACEEALRDILLRLPGVREGKMFGVPGFFVGRKLFACIFGDVVGIKIPEEMAERLLADPRFEPFTPYGKAKMREWVQFACGPADGLDAHEDVLLAAYEFVAASVASE